MKQSCPILLPQVAYNPRAKFARVIRQTVLNRLAGQHLALAALHAGGLPPVVLAVDCELRRQAFATALAHELELYGACATGQVRRGPPRLFGGCTAPSGLRRPRGRAGVLAVRPAG